jgi:hypothetical protein
MGGSRIIVVHHPGVSLKFRAFDGGLDRSAFEKRDLGAFGVGVGVGIGMSIKSSILGSTTSGYAVNPWMVQIRISRPESGEEEKREEKSIRDERRFWPEVVRGRLVEKDVAMARRMSADGEDKVKSEAKREMSSRVFHGRPQTQ